MDTERLTECLEEQLAAIEESKSLAGQITPGVEDMTTATYYGLGGFDMSAFNSSRGLWAQTLGQYSAGFSSTLKDYFGAVAGGNTGALPSLMGNFESSMRDSYTKAFQSGALKMGNPYFKDIGNLAPRDMRFINGAVRTEMGYLRNFLDKTSPLVANGGVPPLYRGQRYVKTLDSMFSSGMVGAAGPNHVFWWDLGAVDMHCPDCVTLNAGNPYTKETLPTVPRAGETQCIFNCKCTLRVSGLGEGEMGHAFPGEGLDANASVSVRTLDGMPVSAGIHSLFDGLYRQMNVLRAKMMVATGSELEMLIGQRAHINRNVIGLAKQYNVNVVPRWGVADIRAVVNTLTEQGLGLITDLRQLSPGQELYLVSGGGMRVAIVEMQGGVLGFNINGVWQVVQSLDDIVLFGKVIEVPWKPSGSMEYAGRWGEKSVLTDVFYHGTSIKNVVVLTKGGFKPGKIGSGTDFGLYGRGYYFTTSQSLASSYAGMQEGGVLSVRINVSNVLTSRAVFARAMEQARVNLKISVSAAKSGPLPILPGLNPPLVNTTTFLILVP